MLFSLWGILIHSTNVSEKMLPLNVLMNDLEFMTKTFLSLKSQESVALSSEFLGVKTC